MSCTLALLALLGVTHAHTLTRAAAARYGREWPVFGPGTGERQREIRLIQVPNGHSCRLRMALLLGSRMGNTYLDCWL